MTRIVALCLAFAVCLVVANGAAADDKADQIKTAFLYNFTKFIEWPNAGGSFVVGVVGDDAFGKAVAAALNGKAAGSGTITVQQLPAGASADDIAKCHMAYIGSSEAGRAGDLAGALKGKPVLTVSDIAGFADKGGGIGFVTTDTVGLEINKKTIEGGGMKVNAKLLQLAKKVID